MVFFPVLSIPGPVSSACTLLWLLSHSCSCSVPAEVSGGSCRSQAQQSESAAACMAALSCVPAELDVSQASHCRKFCSAVRRVCYSWPAPGDFPGCPSSLCPLPGEQPEAQEQVRGQLGLGMPGTAQCTECQHGPFFQSTCAWGITCRGVWGVLERSPVLQTHREKKHTQP